jgi:hypothetical protein
MKSTLLSLGFLSLAGAFAPHASLERRVPSALPMAEEGAAAAMVTGEELEMMLTEWDQPLVVDAYATW